MRYVDKHRTLRTISCLALTGVPGELARWGGFEGEVAVRRTDGEGAI